MILYHAVHNQWKQFLEVRMMSNVLLYIQIIREKWMKQMHHQL